MRENRWMVEVAVEHLGGVPMGKLGGVDIAAFCDALRRRGMAPASVRPATPLSPGPCARPCAAT